MPRRVLEGARRAHAEEGALSGVVPDPLRDRFGFLLPRHCVAVPAHRLEGGPGRLVGAGAATLRGDAAATAAWRAAVKASAFAVGDVVVGAAATAPARAAPAALGVGRSGERHPGRATARGSCHRRAVATGRRGRRRRHVPSIVGRRVERHEVRAAKPPPPEYDASLSMLMNGRWTVVACGWRVDGRLGDRSLVGIVGRVWGSLLLGGFVGRVWGSLLLGGFVTFEVITVIDPGGGFVTFEVITVIDPGDAGESLLLGLLFTPALNTAVYLILKRVNLSVRTCDYTRGAHQGCASNRLVQSTVHSPPCQSSTDQARNTLRGERERS